jgi:drug/metabolite transporter (DMT)-like permease
MLNSICAMFIFKIITLFRQHIYPLVSTVRKCITVGVSILYFGHHIEILQIAGIIIVFFGVLLEIAVNYKFL